MGWIQIYARKFEHYMYAFEHPPQNNSIMPKILLEKRNYAQLILAVLDALFHPCRHE